MTLEYLEQARAFRMGKLMETPDDPSAIAACLESRVNAVLALDNAIKLVKAEMEKGNE